MFLNLKQWLSIPHNEQTINREDYLIEALNTHQWSLAHAILQVSYSSGERLDIQRLIHKSLTPLFSHMLDVICGKIMLEMRAGFSVEQKYREEYFLGLNSHYAKFLFIYATKNLNATNWNYIHNLLEDAYFFTPPLDNVTYMETCLNNAFKNEIHHNFVCWLKNRHILEHYSEHIQQLLKDRGDYDGASWVDDLSKKDIVVSEEDNMQDISWA